MFLRALCILFPFIYVTSGLKVSIQQPIKNGTVDVGVIITPGADINGEAYGPLASKLQEAFPARMWTALLCDFPFNTPNPLQLGQGVMEAISKFKAAGFKGDNIFLAGHSLGGVFVGEYGLSHGSQLTGVMLFASYITRSHRLRDYPVPLLTISGDLDGLTRITRIVDTFEELKNETIHNPSSISQIYKTPVIVMRGINHGHFASGSMPPNVRSHDLPVDDDITFDFAHETIASHVAAFITVTIGLPRENYLTAVASIKMSFFNTQQMLQPLSTIKAMDLNVEKQSLTTASAQKLLLGNMLAAHVEVNDTELSQETIDFYQPDVQLRNTTFAHVQTYSSIVMPFDPEDVSLNPQTPEEVQSVMKSKYGMVKLLPSVPFDSANLTCRNINEHFYQEAIKGASDLARKRFKERKSPSISFRSDIRSNSLVTWAFDALDLEYGNKGELTVTSYAFTVDPNDGEEMAGTHYCKLLSPYRAMEWFYIDSLKRIN